MNHRSTPGFDPTQLTALTQESQRLFAELQRLLAEGALATVTAAEWRELEGALAALEEPAVRVSHATLHQLLSSARC